MGGIGMFPTKRLAFFFATALFDLPMAGSGLGTGTVGIPLTAPQNKHQTNGGWRSRRLTDREPDRGPAVSGPDQEDQPQ